MTHSPRSPRLLKGGLVLLDPASAAIRRIIVLQYNPDSLSRTIQGQAMGGEGGGAGDRSEALRLKGPPVETLKIEAELDASDQLEHPDQGEGAKAAELGLHPALAALETILYPASEKLMRNDAMARSGSLEIAPIQAPLCLFVWSRQRIVPVRITDLSITEEAFDPNLNPLRAKVSLGLRVLSAFDLGFDHKGGQLYLAYHRQKESLADRMAGGGLGALGLGGIP